MDSSSSFSIVSRAKTAIHSAAAKAEKVFTDIRAIDLKPDRENEGQSQKDPRMSIDREIVVPNDCTKTQVEAELGQSNEGGKSNSCTKPRFPPASLVKQLAIAIEAGKSYKSMSELRSSGDSSFLKEKAGLTLSVVKSLVLREKDEKSNSELTGDEEIQSLIFSLFKIEDFDSKNESKLETVHNFSSISKDNLHGSPIDCFVHQLSEIIGSLSSLQKMGLLWHSLILQLRNLWTKGEPIPNIPLDKQPDLNCCLLYQHLQVINCCIARKKRRKIATESPELVLKESVIEGKQYLDSKIYARNSDGKYILRLGADSRSENLTMLETGEPVYSPVLQEGPILTEELIKENEEFVLRTGSVGAGCSQLLSDMQAFKAANPGCVLEDFIRWHSPPDWTEFDQVNKFDSDGSSRRGRLSDRMQKKGNLWHELWETAKPLPAVEQTPLFDEDLAVESIFNALEDIQPSSLFEQLLSTILSVSFVAAEATIHLDNNLNKLFVKCKDYINATYEHDLPKQKLEDICKVYETIEAIVVNPQDSVTIVEPSDEKTGFKKISLNFISKDRVQLWKRNPKEEKKSTQQKDEKTEKSEKSEKISDVFSHLLEKKASIFSKKNVKSEKIEASPSSSLDEDGWTIL